MRYFLLVLLLAGCLADVAPAIEAAPETTACHEDWSDCERSDGVCPAHGIAYQCGCKVEIPGHCSWQGSLVCCDYLPPVDLPTPMPSCRRLDDADHELCPAAIAYACRELPPHCQWAAPGLACCMPFI